MQTKLDLLAANGQEPPPPNNLVVLRVIVIILSLGPPAAFWIMSVVKDDLGIGGVVRALVPFSSLLLICHVFVTIEVTPHLSKWELGHVFGWWLIFTGGPIVYTYVYKGEVSPFFVIFSLFFSAPFCMLMDRVRMAVRVYQLRVQTAGEFVDWMFVETMTLAGPVLYVTMETSAALLSCKPLSNGDGPRVGQFAIFSEFFGMNPLRTQKILFTYDVLRTSPDQHNHQTCLTNPSPPLHPLQQPPPHTTHPAL